MKRSCLFLAMFLALCGAASAQVNGVTVELRLEQELFLPNEDLKIAARIGNLSGQTLHLGKENDWLIFNIENLDRKGVGKLGDVPVEGEFTLDSSQAGTKRVNLTPYFDFRRPGRYQVTASVRLPQWGKVVTSAPKRFDVINGTKLREVEFGLPLPRNAAPGTQPEVRKYILQQATYLKDLKLYFRLTDQSGARTIRVFPIGSMTSFGQPEMQIDKQSNLHVLHQTGARAFNYCVINPDGDLVVRQTHDATESRPKLHAEESGRISVAGGTRRVTAGDIPVPSTAANDADPTKP